MRWNVLLFASLLMTAGCSDRDDDMSAYEPEPEVDPALSAQNPQATFDHMVDAALLADMTVADYHFLPHRPILSPHGKERVIRLAHLIREYGGMINFNTFETDSALVADRTDEIVTTLQANGVDTTQAVVRASIPGSTGMEAREAILIKQNENVYTPQSGATNSGAPPLLNP